MSLEQFAEFIKVLPKLESVLREKGETVPRPNYSDSGLATDENDHGEVQAEAAEEDDEGTEG